MGNPSTIGRLPARRLWTNRMTRWVVASGGAAVIGTIGLIFAYLLWVVAPIFAPAEIESERGIGVVERTSVLVDVSENGELYLRISDDGILEFYDAASGAPVSAFKLGINILAAQRVSPTVDTYVLLDDARRLHFVAAQFTITFEAGVRKLTPRLGFPFGKRPLDVGEISAFEAQLHDSQLVVATSRESTLTLYRYDDVARGFALPPGRQISLQSIDEPVRLLMGPRNAWLYAMSSSGVVDVIGIRSFVHPQRLYQGDLSGGRQITAMGAVLGRYSLLLADANGRINQWGIFNDASGFRMQAMRSFQLDDAAVRIVSEPRRKGFAALDQSGRLTLLYPTSGRILAERMSSLTGSEPMAIAPRSDVLIAAAAPGRLSTFELDNEHPEISFSALWREVWYEGYDGPIFSWQSSSADNDFEPKFSLTPLAFGTLKAAFYALLFAVPIAIMGALYTAYFMAPAMRAWVKPGIEIMAALPTVILGFIGGLWLAPIIEAYLSSVLGVIAVLPLGLFLLALLWTLVPERIAKPLHGWYGLLVAPLIVLMVYVAFDVGPFLEDTLFGGDSKAWFREVMGLGYDQRNALVVGIVMGLAVIPIIFSIAEDAIYGVPTHLINGSLALGATPWQTLVRVVLLTASPGIFSAVMIGMGRAVGETMIVLMATGNTPLMDFNIFEGMRTFAANIAVELPESEVDSTHYRILFLAALVLFILTFLFNTFAEVVRQRLRVRYGSL